VNKITASEHVSVLISARMCHYKLP